jgi:hypothetical protein
MMLMVMMMRREAVRPGCTPILAKSQLLVLYQAQLGAHDVQHQMMWLKMQQCQSVATKLAP